MFHQDASDWAALWHGILGFDQAKHLLVINIAHVAREFVGEEQLVTSRRCGWLRGNADYRSTVVRAQHHRPRQDCDQHEPCAEFELEPAAARHRRTELLLRWLVVRTHSAKALFMTTAYLCHERI